MNIRFALIYQIRAHKRTIVTAIFLGSCSRSPTVGVNRNRILSSQQEPSIGLFYYNTKTFYFQYQSIFGRNIANSGTRRSAGKRAL